MLPLPLEKALLKQISLESKKRLKNLVSVLATSMPVIKIREEVVETAKTNETAKAVEIAKMVETTRTCETAKAFETSEAIEISGAGKDGKESKDEYLENLV